MNSFTAAAPQPKSLVPGVEVRTWTNRELVQHLPRLAAYHPEEGPRPLSRDLGWLKVLGEGLGHQAYCLEAVETSQTRGILPLAFVRSLLFGRFLVSLPYLNYGGVIASDDRVAGPLIDRAVELAVQLKVRFLELRQEKPVDHLALTDRMNSKVLMRLDLPGTPGKLWEQLSCKVRNQVRKGTKIDLKVAWGCQELLDDFYTVFSRNMRDLGTPVYGKKLFAAVLEQFPKQAEFCVIRAGNQPVAAALLLHGDGVTEVPSASSLRAFNHTCANMLLYWNLLERAILRGQTVFDFGRSSRDSSTYAFKKQWGAEESPSEWLYYRREGGIDAVRPSNPRYERLIALWKRLPLWVARIVGPVIVRGIP